MTGLWNLFLNEYHHLHYHQDCVQILIGVLHGMQVVLVWPGGIRAALQNSHNWRATQGGGQHQHIPVDPRSLHWTAALQPTAQRQVSRDLLPLCLFFCCHWWCSLCLSVCLSLSFSLSLSLSLFLSLSLSLSLSPSLSLPPSLPPSPSTSHTLSLDILSFPSSLSPVSPFLFFSLSLSLSLSLCLFSYLSLSVC